MSLSSNSSFAPEHEGRATGWTVPIIHGRLLVGPSPFAGAEASPTILRQADSSVDAARGDDPLAGLTGGLGDDVEISVVMKDD